MTTGLVNGDLKRAKEIWWELKNGTPDAHKHLKSAPTRVRNEILKALSEAANNGPAKNNPFE